MRKHYFGLFILIFLIQSGYSSAQLRSSSVTVKDELGKFILHLNTISFDPAMLNNIGEVARSEINSTSSLIQADNLLPNPQKIKAMRSLVFFLRDLGTDIDEKKIDVYDIPATIRSYQVLLNALLHHGSVENVLEPLSPRRCRLLAGAFRQYDNTALMEDIAVYKFFAATPKYIIPFLQKNPSFRFADSLLFQAAAIEDPAKTYSYLSQHPDKFQDKINSNIYLQQIFSISQNKLASELMPFIVSLSENKIMQDTILSIRTDVTAYFQLLVNTLKDELVEHDEQGFPFHAALRNGIKQKSLSFYVNSINDLHSSPDNIRFASVKNLRPEDLYYLITSCEDELYTSSYLGLYRRLMEQLKDHPADSIFEVVHFDNFRIFMRMAANYNTLADFLGRLPQATAADLLRRFISGIEKDIDTGVEKAMDVADAFAGLSNVAGTSEQIDVELKSNLERCRSNQLFFGTRLYDILIQVFDLVKNDDPGNKLWQELGNYELLDRRSIQNQNGETVEMVLFYGDEDGEASFNNFLSFFKNSNTWKVTKNNLWATIRSTSEQPIVIYANLPLDTKQELDVQAQDSMSAYMEQQSVKPVILIHRGHSYHLGKTLAKMQPSVKLALLGSCGGYNSILSVANINPDAQIIVTKKTGSKLVNDPMIDEINQTLLGGKDLVWSAVWVDLQKRFSKDEFTLNLFNEYLPPVKNLSLFVLKLFNNYK